MNEDVRAAEIRELIEGHLKTGIRESTVFALVMKAFDTYRESGDADAIDALFRVCFESYDAIWRRHERAALRYRQWDHRRRSREAEGSEHNELPPVNEARGTVFAFPALIHTARRQAGAHRAAALREAALLARPTDDLTSFLDALRPGEESMLAEDAVRDNLTDAWLELHFESDAKKPVAARLRELLGRDSEQESRDVDDVNAAGWRTMEAEGAAAAFQTIDGKCGSSYRRWMSRGQFAKYALWSDLACDSFVVARRIAARRWQLDAAGRAHEFLEDLRRAEPRDFAGWWHGHEPGKGDAVNDARAAARKMREGLPFENPAKTITEYVRLIDELEQQQRYFSAAQLLLAFAQGARAQAKVRQRAAPLAQRAAKLAVAHAQPRLAFEAQRFLSMEPLAAQKGAFTRFAADALDRALENAHASGGSNLRQCHTALRRWLLTQSPMKLWHRSTVEELLTYTDLERAPRRRETGANALVLRLLERLAAENAVLIDIFVWNDLQVDAGDDKKVLDQTVDGVGAIVVLDPSVEPSVRIHPISARDWYEAGEALHAAVAWVSGPVHDAQRGRKRLGRLRTALWNAFVAPVARAGALTSDRRVYVSGGRRLFRYPIHAAMAPDGAGLWHNRIVLLQRPSALLEPPARASSAVTVWRRDFSDDVIKDISDSLGKAWSDQTIPGDALLKELRGKHALLFAHGVDGGGDTRILLGGGAELALSDIRSAGNLSGTELILAACWAGKTKRDETSRDEAGILPALLSAGTDVVLAPIWPVDAIHACRFVKEYAMKREASVTAEDAWLHARAVSLEPDDDGANAETSAVLREACAIAFVCYAGRPLYRG